MLIIKYDFEKSIEIQISIVERLSGLTVDIYVKMVNNTEVEAITGVCPDTIVGRGKTNRISVNVDKGTVLLLVSIFKIQAPFSATNSF